MDQMQKLPHAAAPRKGKAVLFLTVIVLLLLLAVAGLGVYTYWQRQEAQQMQHELTVEKDSIAHSLQQVLVDYGELETSNEALRIKMDEERARAQKLLGEIQQVKQMSFAKIKEYQRELGTLRAIMRKMVGEIDSLNTLNQNLIAENARIRGQYSETQQNLERVASKNEELASTLQRGAVIKARNVSLIGLNAREKEVNRAKKSQKLKVCMTLMENAIPTPGLRYVIIRILGPDGLLLADPNGGTFALSGAEVQYSAKREVDYQNEDLEVCLFYGDKSKFQKGKYSVEVYIDGNSCGAGEALLK